MNIKEKAEAYAHYIASNSGGYYYETYKEVKQKFLNSTKEQQNKMYFWTN